MVMVPEGKYTKIGSKTISESGAYPMNYAPVA